MLNTNKLKLILALLVALLSSLALISCEKESKPQTSVKGLKKGVLPTRIETLYAANVDSLNGRINTGCVALQEVEVNKIYTLLKNARNWTEASTKESKCNKIATEASANDLTNLAKNTQTKAILENLVKQQFGENALGGKTIKDWAQTLPNSCKDKNITVLPVLKKFYSALKDSKKLPNASTRTEICTNLSKKLSYAELFSLINYSNPMSVAAGLYPDLKNLNEGGGE